ncbi:hypothetical protein [Algoriphagus faecimaris]|uniref:hypothetical protein n=1 Tax=Algoriphagus faecimaris TaxID=686796 RepID=UPI001123E319|nr:hypothetical protein [Algoriphagus faecimaris]
MSSKKSLFPEIAGYFYKMHSLKKILSLISWLSIDVVVGAMAGMLFFSYLLHVNLAWPAYSLLALAVWCIYNLDHYLDARKVELNSPRRLFHQNANRVILVFIGLFGILGLLGGYWWFGWGLELQLTLALAALIVGVRFIIWHFGKGWMKEFSIALFYVIGISWLPFLRSSFLDRTYWFLVFFGLYLGLALLNLLILSQLDSEEDQKAGFFAATRNNSISTLSKWTDYLSWGLIGVCLLLFMLSPSFYKIFIALILMMTLVHWMVFRQKVKDEEKQRFVMEWAFSIPWVLLLF